MDDNCTLVRLFDDGESTEELPSADYDEWLDSALTWGLQVTCESVLEWRYFREAVRDPRATPCAAQTEIDANPRVVAIHWREGNRHAYLGLHSAWGSSGPPTIDNLRARAAAGELLGVGLHPSPARMGQATMRASLEKKYTATGRACTDDLRANLIGGRAELNGPVWGLPLAWEIDRRMAYVQECLGDLPVGTACAILPNPSWERLAVTPIYYVLCVVVILRPLRVGPFPFRSPRGNYVYPTRPGTYEDVWLWKGEVEDTRAAGCTVVIRGGWEWLRAEPALHPWAEKMLAARDVALDDAVAAIVKKCAVAAIGWHAMRPCYLIVKEATGEFADCPPILTLSGTITNYVVVETLDDSPCQLLAWASFIWSQARRTLLRAELEEKAAGNRVLMTNFDSILLTEPSKTERAAWREQALTNVSIHASRSVISDQKIILPGLHGEVRDKAIAYAMAVRGEAERRRGEPRQLPKGYEKLDRESGELVWHDGTPHRGFEEGWKVRDEEGGRRRLGGPRRRPRGD